MRTSSVPSGSLASPMFSVLVRMVVARKRRSHSSTASQRSSSGVRFQRLHDPHTTHSRPFSASNASRRPTGKCSMLSFSPSREPQKMQVEYMRDDEDENAPAGERPAP